MTAFGTQGTKGGTLVETAKPETSEKGCAAMADIEGVCIAMCTPLDSTGEVIDESRLRDYIDEIIDTGMHSILVGAGTGEYAYMTEEEIRMMVEVCCTHIDGRVPVAVQSTRMGTANTIEATKHATDFGADAVMILPPWLESPFERGVVWHYEEIARRTNVDIIMYNTPQASGVEITPAMYRRLIAVDNIKYLKDSEGDLAKLQKFTAIGGKVLCGADPIAPYALMAGAVGWIWGSANVMPHECVRLYELINSGQLSEALELWKLMEPLNSFLWDNDFGVEYLVGAKTAANMVGRNLGPNRKPQLPVTGEARVALQAVMSPLPTNKIDRSRLVYRSWEEEQDWMVSMSNRSSATDKPQGADAGTETR